MFTKLYVAHMKGLFKARGQLALTLLMPVLMAVFFGFSIKVGDRKPDLGVVLLVPTAASEAFVEAMEQSRLFKLTRLSANADLPEALGRDRLEAALIVPDLSSGESLKLLFDEKRPERLQSTPAKLSAFVQSYNLSLANAKQEINFEISGLHGPLQATYNYLLPGIIVFGVVMSSMAAGTSQVAGLRQKGVFKRLMVTPLSARSFFLADMVSRATIVVIQVALVLAVGIIGYDAERGWDLAWIPLLAVLGTLVFFSIGYFLAAVTDNPETSAGVASTVSLILVIASGALPTNFFPAAVDRALKYLPVTPMVNAMRGVVVDKTGPFSAAPIDTSVLIAWFVITLVLAIVFFKFKEPARKT